MLGQWEHNYPDQWTKHNNQESGYGGEAIQNMTRWDWGQDLSLIHISEPTRPY